MQKIASPQDLQAELQRLLAYCQGPENPSRAMLASELRELADRVAVAPTGLERYLQTAWKEAVAKVHPESSLMYARVDERAPGPWLASGEFFMQAGEKDVYPRMVTKPNTRALRAAIAAIAKTVERKFGVHLSLLRPKVKHERFTLGFYVEESGV